MHSLGWDVARERAGKYARRRAVQEKTELETKQRNITAENSIISGGRVPSDHWPTSVPDHVPVKVPPSENSDEQMWVLVLNSCDKL